MLTDEQNKIFSEILDLNYEVSKGDESKETELNTKKRELMDSMGNAAYCKFMAMGAKLFS